MKLKPLLIIILVPSIIFGSIFLYNLYTDHEKLQKYAEGWKEYSDLKMQEVEEPSNLTGIILFSTQIWEFHNPKSYPIVQQTYYQDVYVKYTFLMPWGDIEEIWVDTQRWAFTR